MKNQKRWNIESANLPDYWLNLASLVKDEYPLPLESHSDSAATIETLSGLYSAECARVELLDGKYGTEREISIPGEVFDRYLSYRATPLVRATEFEKYLQYDGQIYYKSEGSNPGGSHKPNTAFAQAYYAKQQGLRGVVTDTGAGQWGTSLAMAAHTFGLECIVFMTQSSYRDKPYRRYMMQLAEAEVYPSPSSLTERGRGLLAEDPNHVGSLGIGMGEAMEYAQMRGDYRLALGCMAYHASMHQTIVGLELIQQIDEAEIEPDIIVGCVGGGSSLVGFSAPFLEKKIKGLESPRIVAAESSNAPSLTKGEFRYDHADTFEYTPKFKMYTLGHEFVPPRIHAGGLRYHGKATILSLMAEKGYVEAMDITQEDAFRAGKTFFLVEGLLPAPESSHAISAVTTVVKEAQTAGKAPTIVMSITGNGYLDLQGYATQLNLLSQAP
ncbi:MAG: TrpB-like pyridoxal phosphate-dependent enzyme [Pyrinomonadaceae bacterium]